MEEVKTRKQVIPNPTGKGGFGENPQNRNSGMWKKEDSIGYQYNKLLRLTLQEFEEWVKENPKKVRTMAQDIAYKAVMNARDDLNYLKEVTDRTEGKPRQQTDLTSGGNTINPLLVKFIGEEDDTNPDTERI